MEKCKGCENLGALSDICESCLRNDSIDDYYVSGAEKTGSYYLVFCINSDNEREKRDYFNKDYSQVLYSLAKDVGVVDIASIEKIY